MSNIIYSWKFDDNKNRWALWYIIAISVVLWLAIWGFFTKQYWMSFIVLLIAWLVYFVENNSEDNVEIFLSDLWIKIDNGFYDYSKIDSYWFIYNWENSILLRLNLNTRWLRNIDVKVDNNITSDLKNILPNYINENPKSELTFSEKIINLLKL